MITKFNINKKVSTKRTPISKSTTPLLLETAHEKWESSDEELSTNAIAEKLETERAKNELLEQMFILEKQRRDLLEELVHTEQKRNDIFEERLKIIEAKYS